MKIYDKVLLYVVMIVVNIASVVNIYQSDEMHKLKIQIEKLEQQAHPAPKGASLDQLIEMKREQQCGELKRLPCLMATGYWR